MIMKCISVRRRTHFNMSSSLLAKGISFVFFLAFGSLYIQLPGLIGDDGVAPARLLNLNIPKTLDDFLLGIPSIVRYRSSLQLSEYHATEFLVVFGMVLAFLSTVVSAFCNSLTMLLQWVLYVSVVMVCPGLTDWKWTSLLIESGFLCFLYLFTLRRNSKSATVVSLWLFKWLLFREAISSGFAALSDSNLPWHDLSAMNNFFLPRISPTPASWFLTNQPKWILRALTMLTISMKIFVPFLYFIPICEIKYFVFFASFLYHANFVLVDNDNIYSILLLVLSLVLLPQPKRRPKKRSVLRKLLAGTLFLAVISVMVYVIWDFFGLEKGIAQAHLTIPRSLLISNGKKAIAYVIQAACVLFVLSVIIALGRALSANGYQKKMKDLCSVIIVTLLGTGLFLGSLPPFAGIADSGSVVFLPRIAHELSETLKPFCLSNDYRFFNRKDRDVLMRASEQRTTLVLESATAEKGPWKEIVFHHIPSLVDKAPTFIPGHFPILDSEVAISGDKTFENSPILATLVYRLLTGQKEVLPLVAHTGFPDGIKYIQIKKYDYKISERSSEQWWTRTLRKIYLPPTDFSSQRLTQLMFKLGVAGKRRSRPVDPNAISTTLDKLRAVVGQPTNLNGFFVVLAVVMVLNKLFI
nr:lipase maturation factor [Hymenolepis microstoma]